MKTFVLKISTFVCVILLLLTATMWTSCKKDKVTHGKVTAVTEAHVPVGGATVHLAAPSANGQLSYTGTTDGTGLASFDVPLPGIWDVTITKDTLTGTGVLRLDEPGKSDAITVILR